MEPIVVKSEDLDIHSALLETDHPGNVATVFCHGAFEHQGNWFAYAQRLNSEGLVTCTFDFAGHGKSEGLRGLVNLRVWAHNIRDVLNYLQTRGYEQFALVGWGLGGSAALLAAAHDRRLSCAVLLASPIYLLPPLPERVAYSLLTAVARLKKAISKRPLTLSRLNELGEMRIASDQQVNERYFSDPNIRRIYQAIPVPDSLDSVWFDVTHVIERVHIPVLVLHGGEDAIVSVDQSERLYALLRSPKALKLVEGSGHALHLDREKEAVYTLIYNWIQEQGIAGGI
jgi:alpha-beta hydrolase superfamily lysophospholipase